MFTVNAIDDHNGREETVMVAVVVGGDDHRVPVSILPNTMQCLNKLTRHPDGYHTSRTSVAGVVDTRHPWWRQEYNSQQDKMPWSPRHLVMVTSQAELDALFA